MMDKNSVNKILRVTKLLLIVAGVIGLVATLVTGQSMSKLALCLSIAVAVWLIVDTIINTENRKQRYLRLAVLGAVLVIVLAVSFLSVRAIFAGGQPSAIDPEETSQTKFSSISGQFPSDTKTINPDFPAGTCVNLHGSRTNAQVDKAGCGSPENNFIVVQQVQKPSECVGDVDQKYYTNTAGRGEWTVCMDYYWVQGSCLSMNGFEIKRVKCDDSAKPAREKPVRLAQNSTSIADCPTGGYAHPVRRFTVCTETQG